MTFEEATAWRDFWYEVRDIAQVRLRAMELVVACSKRGTLQRRSASRRARGYAQTVNHAIMAATDCALTRTKRKHEARGTCDVPGHPDAKCHVCGYTKLLTEVIP